MNKRILQANGAEDFSVLPEKIALHTEGAEQQKWAYDWPNEPIDNSGGYLLQMHTNYKGDDCWFSTLNRRIRMNSIRRSNDLDFGEEAAALKDWMQRRAQFLDDYIGGKGQNASEEYCRVLFRFSWGNLSHYVRRGESLGYLPLPEYGETQIPSELEKNEIIGWQDEDGNAIRADIVIDSDCTFSPVYRQ